ncbi:carbonic anhydrase [Alkaliphilus pronyensis]|uniref:carbonic anhydrase n=1 Tax=Alkaliphilus pronyensis TaxID=1482732 RepID=UPI001A9AEB0B|nr:carbonic anhydrase [Alkaliphilus pronyensis]
MNMTDRFVTTINCMDGRTQKPVIDFMKSEYGADFVDMITEAGPNKILAEYTNKLTVDSIKKRVAISIEKHNSKVIAIVGHYDCGGNPANEDTQIKQILQAVRNVEAWNRDVEVIGLWVDENWKVNRVACQYSFRYSPVSINQLAQIKKLKLSRLY